MELIVIKSAVAIGPVLAMLAAKARIYSRAYQDGLVEMDAEAPESVVRNLRQWVRKG